MRRPPPPPHDMTCGFLIQLVFVTSQLRHSLVVHPLLRDGPLGGGEGGGSGGRSTKKYSRQGKLNEKNSCMPINPKKYSCMA